MTGSDLIALVPWVIFGAALAVVVVRLRRSRRQPPRRPPGRARPGRGGRR